MRAASVDLDGTIKIEDAVTLTGNIDLANGSKIILGTGITATETAFTVGDVVSTGTTTIEVSTSFTSGTIVLFDSTADASGDLANLTIADTALIDYTLAANANDIEITATAKTAETTAGELGVSVQDARALSNGSLAIATNNATLLTNLNAALTAGGASAAKAAESIGVQADTLGAGVNVAVSVGGRVIGILSDRLASLRYGTQYASTGQTGFSSGNNGLSNAAWMKTFGNWINQDSDGGVSGFDANTYGVAFGMDTDVNESSRAGISVSYANSDVDGSGAGDSKADIDSFQVTAYTDYTGKNFYTEASLGYAYNKNDVSRVIDFSGTDTIASGNYSSNQFVASIGGGIPIQIKNSAFFTPTAGLAWTSVLSESYTETGAGGLNQRVDIDNINVLLGSLGGKLHSQIKVGNAYLVPELRGGISYDFIGDAATATAKFTGGGSAFTVEGADVEQFGGNIGFGLTYTGDLWTVGASYDADMKSGYVSQTAQLKARIKF